MSNTLLSTVRDLSRRKARRRRGLTVAEGVRLVEEVLDADGDIRGVVTAPMLQASARGRALKDRLAARTTSSIEVSDSELIELADTEHPQGVIAVLQPPAYVLEDVAVAPGRPVLVLDGVQDPGNVGALCRTALGLGAAGVVALPGTGELFGPKALRGSMGALLRLPAVRSDDAALAEWIGRRGIEVWLAAHDGVPLTRAPLRDAPIALVLGNEGAGAGAATVAALASYTRGSVAVPLGPAVESLNVAVAAGILLYEVVRDR